jgi:DNA-binding MarR family transcriptional regulator
MVSRIVRGLDAILHERSRLSIATALKTHGHLSFIELRDLLEMTDGNLCVHVRTLENKGYLSKTKGSRNGRVHTICSLTEAGATALSQYVKSMEQLIRALDGDEQN